MDRGALAGLEYAARFGERERLPGGWRAWLARWFGRGDLSGVPVAAVAAVASGAGDGVRGATRWIATPVELAAGLTRVHLDRRGIVRLAPDEQAALAEAFHRTFAGSGLTLEPLSDGQFLAVTPGIAAVATTRARALRRRGAGSAAGACGGAAAAADGGDRDVAARGSPQPGARGARGAAVTGLWLWGATGEELCRHVRARCPRQRRPARRDGRLRCGCIRRGPRTSRRTRAARRLPDPPDAAFADPGTERTVLVAELAGGLPRGGAVGLVRSGGGARRRLVRPAIDGAHERRRSVG